MTESKQTNTQSKEDQVHSAIANCVLPPLYLSQYSTKKLRVLDTQKYLGVTLSSHFTLTEYIYVSKKINQRLGLLRRIKSLLPGSARILFLNSLILPMFMPTLFGGTRIMLFS